jgi:hypothetical protein
VSAVSLTVLVVVSAVSLTVLVVVSAVSLTVLVVVSAVSPAPGTSRALAAVDSNRRKRPVEIITRSARRADRCDDRGGMTRDVATTRVGSSSRLP